MVEVAIGPQRSPGAPVSIGPIAVPDDDVSVAAWRWATRALPRYLLDHSVRSYAWGVTIARREDIAFEARILWAAALFHDVGLTTIPRNRRCFEVQGAAVARRTLERFGMDPTDAATAAKAIVDHMAPAVTLADGPESLLLDRATGLDVRGVAFGLIDEVRDAVVLAAPRRDFDRRFVAAIRREVDRRTGCQSARLLRDGDLVGSMGRSPWAAWRGR